MREPAYHSDERAKERKPIAVEGRGCGWMVLRIPKFPGGQKHDRPAARRRKASMAPSS